MKRVRATILYEDSGVSGHEFGPHRFLIACVADRTEVDLHELHRALEARPMNGIDSLVRSLRHGDKIARDGRWLIAVVDGDRVRRHVGLPSDAAMDKTCTTLARLVPEPAKVQVFVIERNLETLLAAVEHCFDGSAREYAREARSKDTLARDLAFRAASAQALRPQRDCVLSRVPALRACTEFLASTVIEGPADA